MKIRTWWKSLPFFWQMYLFLIASIAVVITLVEIVFEPMAWHFSRDFYGSTPTADEIIVWTIGVPLPALVIGWLITRMVVARLEGLERATRTLTTGDLKTRMDESGDERDVFTRLAKNFNLMAESLEALVANEKRLLVDISHELRSPLTRLNLNIALLEKNRNRDDFDKTVRMLEAEIGQMTKLVKILLTQGPRRLAPDAREKMDLSALIAEIVENFRIVCDANGKTVAMSVTPGLMLFANPLRAKAVIENLLENAMFYTPDGGEIRIEATRKNGNMVAISIRDYGPGVPPQHLEDIFKAFFRVDGSRARNSGGVGLGLALVKESMIRMGGDIVAINANPGLEMRLTMPLAE